MADDGHGGKIDGKVKDRLPVIPDHVAEAMDKGVDVPIESFVTGDARDRLQDMIRDRNRPVKMENMIPVGRNDPRIAHYGKRDGSSLPRVPERRRVIPPPFRRPVAPMRQDHGLAWQIVRADQVEEGWTVTDIGKVVKVETKTDYMLAGELLTDTPEGVDKATEVAVGTTVLILGMGGIAKAFAPSAPLRAFCPEGTGVVLKV